MPIDDKELATMLKSAYEKLTIMNTDRNKLKEFIQRCTGITKQPTEDPEVMKDVMDMNLGIKMSSTRREAIHNRLLSDKTELGI